LVAANKLLAKAQKNPDTGITFMKGALDIDEAIIVSVTDASHAGEEEHRSQAGRLLLLADRRLLDDDQQEAGVYVIEWNSTVIRRVCRSTLQSETLSMIAGCEAATQLRAVLADCYKPLNMSCWEAEAAATRQCVWVTDCKSLETTLTRPATSQMVADKRLNIDLKALRQDLWREQGQEIGDPLGNEQLPNPLTATDIIRWIDTTIMIADPLTKAMDASVMLHVCQQGRWSLAQPSTAAQLKVRRQEQRRAAKDAEKTRKELKELNKEDEDAHRAEQSNEATASSWRRAAADGATHRDAWEAAPGKPS
jgi:hypothetical protein